MLVFVAVSIFFSLWGETSGTFPTSANIKNVLGNQAVLGVLSLAIMFPLVCGEFDFSVGPVAGLAQVLCAGFMARLGMPVGVAVLLGIAVGALVGIVVGLTVARIGVNSLIVTLGHLGGVVGHRHLVHEQPVDHHRDLDPPHRLRYRRLVRDPADGLRARARRRVRVLPARTHAVRALPRTASVRTRTRRGSWGCRSSGS